MSSVATPRTLTAARLALRPSAFHLHSLRERCLPVLLVLSLSGFLFFYGIAGSELYRTECLRAIVAAEMLRSGNWIVPTLYGEPLLTKPPGMYVAIALASWPVGGVTEWTARLPSALAATMSLFLFYWHFGRVLGRPAGLVAAICLPLSVMWLDKASAAEIDMLQVFWVTAALIFCLRALETHNIPVTPSPDHPVTLSPRHPVTPSLFWWLAALLCVAGGVLTKWTAPVFFYGTVIPLLWWRGQLRLLWCRQHLLGVALAGSICSVWAGLVVMQVGWDTLYETVGREALVRLSPGHYPKPYSWAETLTHPLRFLVAALPIALFALPACRPRFAQGLDDRERLLFQAMHCWIWPSLLFWSIVPDHALRNSMPLYPGIAGLAALVIALAPQGRQLIARGVSPWAQGGSCVPLSHLRGSEQEDADGPRGLRPWLLTVAAFAAGPRRGMGFASSALVAVLLVWLGVKLVYVHVVMPARTGDRHTRMKGTRIAAHVPRHAALYLFRFKDEGLMFYYGRKAIRLAGAEQLPSTTEPMYCILVESEWRQWDRRRATEVVLHLEDAQGDPITLVRVWPLASDCHRWAWTRTYMRPTSILPDNAKILSISDLTQAVKGMLEEGFPFVWVAGEISNLTRPSSGHMYLTLKDGGAQLRTVIWRSAVQRLRCDLRDGMEVIAGGRLSVYPQRGDYQLLVDRLQPKGIGELELAFRQLREKLSGLGYFAPERKRPLPAFPRRVALVTSSAGAAVRDMLEILGRRWPALEVVICPVRVQGPGAASEIAEGIELLNRVHLAGWRIDVMIVGRGGGSLEDLWAFNEECVAQAIHASRIPVVSAVGHEVDLTIADLVADRRALTPSEAAELVAPNRVELLEWLNRTQLRIGDLMTGRLAQARRRLEELAQRRVFREPLERLHEQERKLDDWSQRLSRAVKQRLVLAREQLETRSARLEALSPLKVLARGYSLTSTETDGVLVRTPEQVRPGDRLVTRLQQGRIISRVEPDA